MAYTTIDDPSAYFQTVLYTGNQTARSITNDGNSDLQPDWVWDKNRTTSGYHHNLYDSTRGTGKQLRSNTTEAEITQAQGLTAFNSDGFSLGTDDSSNKTSSEYVAWQWKANGGTTASNSDGSITSTVQANTTAGFSIVTYTGTGSNGTIGHGLGVAPSWVLCKDRDGTGVWVTWQNTLAGNQALELQSTNAAADEPTSWNSTVPSSTVFSVGTRGGTNASSTDFVAYCFAEKQGYSKFGSYTGNGSTNGPFIYTGFKPAWVMVKKSGSGTAAHWRISDSTRSTFNPADHQLSPSSSGAEFNENDMDLLSNGFKIRQSSVYPNESAVQFIYMAFAESPFVSSKGVPTTAR